MAGGRLSGPDAFQGRRDDERTLGSFPNARVMAGNGCGRVKSRRPFSIVRETLGAANSERQGRIGDGEDGGSLEQKKREGYF